MKRENRVVDYFSSTTRARAPRGDGAAPRCTGHRCSSTTSRIPCGHERWRQIFLGARYFSHPIPFLLRREHHGKGGELSSTLLWTTHLVSGAHKGESASSSPPPLAHRTRHTPRRPVPLLLPAQICATRRPSRSGVLLRLRWLPLTASMSLSPSLRHPVQNPTGR